MCASGCCCGVEVPQIFVHMSGCGSCLECPYNSLSGWRSVLELPYIDLSGCCARLGFPCMHATRLRFAYVYERGSAGLTPSSALAPFAHTARAPEYTPVTRTPG